MTAPKHKLTPELRDAALRLFGDQGSVAAARFAGVTPRTVQRWARDAGVLPPEERAARTAAANAEIARRQAEAYARLLPTLTHIAERSLAAQLELAGLAADVLAAARSGQAMSAELAQRVRSAESLAGVINARGLVSMSTRAIHDLQLLTGGDTERASGDVRVFLAQLPAAESGEEPRIIDLAPVPRAS